MDQLTILHVAPFSQKKASGLSTAVPSLVAAQNSIKNTSAGLLVSSGNKSTPSKSQFPLFVEQEVLIHGKMENLPEPFDKPDLVIFHSTYIPAHLVFSRQLRKLNIPYIIIPHGGMTREAQSIKKCKKKIANVLLFNKMVGDALAIQYLSKGEADKSGFWDQDFIIAGNGVALPTLESKEEKFEDFSLDFTFIGRLEPYLKGLDLLIQACSLASVELRQSSSKVRIYGPGSDKNLKMLHTLIADFQVGDVVEICGPVYDQDKEDVFRQTDVFVHTSRSEGHPMSVLEALSYGVPCLLTPGTNMSSEVALEGAGWEVELSADSIAEGIRIAVASKPNLTEMSKRARRFVEKKYTWNAVAEKSVGLYRGLLQNRLSNR